MFIIKKTHLYTPTHTLTYKCQEDQVQVVVVEVEEEVVEVEEEVVEAEVVE